MPVYEVEDPKTGAVIELEGDSPPTEAELNEIFASVAPEGSTIDSVVEPVKAIAGGMMNQAASGLAGLANFAGEGVATGLHANAGINRDIDSQGLADTVQNTQEALPDFTPQTQAGQKGLETVGDLMQAGIDIANVPISGLAGLATLLGGDIDSAANTVRDVQEKGLGETLGDNALAATGSPLAATAAFMAPDVVAAVTGTKAVKTAAKTATGKLKRIADARRQKALVTPSGELTPAFEKALKKQGITIDAVVDDFERIPEISDPNKAVNRLIKDKIKRRDTDGALATKRLDNFGNVVDDGLGKAAVKQGFLEGDVQAVKMANKASKSGMRKMLKIRQSILNNTRKGADIHPSNVVGESAMGRFNYLRQVAKDASSELDGIVKQKLRGTKIDTSKVSDKFFNELDSLDVKIDRSTLPPSVNFKGSQVSKNKSAQKVIKDTLDLLAENEPVDALRAHRLKKQLDDMIDYRRELGALTPSGERVAKAVRRELNEVIRAVDDDYARINDTLSESLGAINDFNDVLGRSINPFKDSAESAVGNDLRGLLSNRKTRDKLNDAVKQLDEAANNLGGNFDDDIGDLVNFNAILQDRFGSSRRHSFAGEIGSEVKRNTKNVMRGKEGVQEILIDKMADGFDSLRNVNDQEAFKALNRLLED